MNGLIMDYQLTVPAILRTAEQLYGPQEIVTRLPDKSFHRYTYTDFVRRTKQLAVALQTMGVQPGDRVATLCWNHHQHLEAYFAIPSIGGVLHTLNLRLHPDDLAYIVNHAHDRVIIVDQSLLPLLQQFRDRADLERIIVIGGDAPAGMLQYEDVIGNEDPQRFQYRDDQENAAAALCYTSGTTGRPKGVLYSHRSIVLHALVTASVNAMALGEQDVVMPVVPMFHVNAWGVPFMVTLVGGKHVFPGPHLDPVSLLEDMSQERVTMTAGVPTVWLAVLQELDKNGARYDLSHLKSMVVGGSAAPQAMIEAYDKRHGLKIVHAWGMTEMSPVGTIAHLTPDLQNAPDEEKLRHLATQGRPLFFVDMRAMTPEGPAPWDGKTMGELEVRGPCVASSYFESPESDDKWSEDGYFRTGDIVTIDPRGYIKITDRTKDLIKSGGEWISSVELENALMGHPAVAEAAVIAVSHPHWQERPLAVVVLKEGKTTTPEELKTFLEPKFAKWWLPDAYEFVSAIPRTGTGKFLKSALRDQFRDYPLHIS